MNDTTSTPPSDTQAPRRGLASLADVIRSRDDRVVAGVAGGMAQRFNIDPILIRVLFVVLCFAGLAGLILYAAAWLFLPSEGELRSNVAEWFGLEEREQQVRDIGLATAGLLAFFAVVGDSGWGWGGGWVFWVALWVVLPIAFVAWILRRRRAGTDPYSSWEQNTAADAAAEPATMSTEPQSDAPFASAAEGADTAVLPEAPSEPGSPNEPPTQQSPVSPPLPPRPPRTPFNWVPTLLTACAVAIGSAVTYLVAAPEWTAYVAVALAITGVALLICTFTRGGLPLIFAGLALTGLLAVGSFLPSPMMGEQKVTPTTAAQLDASYSHGMGHVVLDLTQVDDLDDLLGRTVSLDTGLGQTEVILPRDLDVDIDAYVRAGDLDILGEKVNGTSRRIVQSHDDPALTLTIEHTAGQVKVIRR